MRQEEYKVASLEKSNRLANARTKHFKAGKEATEHTDSYVLTTVFFAAVLFFAGISMRFVWQRMRIAVLALGSLFLACTRSSSSPGSRSCSGVRRAPGR